MAEPIGPGDMVECVNTGPLPNSMGVIVAAPLLTLGAIYTVNKVARNWALYLRGCPNRPGFFGYNPKRFRPISRRRDFNAILEKLKQPAPSEPARTPETV